VWQVMVPPYWLRDLLFMTDYQGKQKPRADFIDELFEALRTRLCEQAIILFRDDMVGNSSSLKTEDLTGQALNLVIQGVGKRRKRANTLLGTYYEPIGENGAMVPSALDLIIFKIDVAQLMNNIRSSQKVA